MFLAPLFLFFSQCQKCKLSIKALSFMSCFLLTYSAIANQAYDSKIEAAYNAFANHDYRDAFTLYERQLSSPIQGASINPIDIVRAVECLSALKAFDELDGFLESVVEAYPKNWTVLSTVGSAYLTIPKNGYILDGEFTRGHHRGGRAEYVTTRERDRAQSLMLQLKALSLAKVPNRASTEQMKGIYQELATAVFKARERASAWQLQHLTDLTKLPDYETPHYGRSSTKGAPVTERGNPVFYMTPKSFQAAKNDGERWRFLLNKLGSYSEEEKQNSLMLWADFLWQQFGVQTMAYTQWFQGHGNRNDSNKEAGFFQLNTLSDSETIAKLASGIKRFKLSKEQSFIRAYQQLEKSGRHAEVALERLATIYENRKQLDTAASYWQQAINRFGSSGSRQKRLDQIVGDWAGFEPSQIQAAGDDANSVLLRYRNAASVSLSIYKLDVKKYLEDMKSHLASNPKNMEWNKLQLSQIGYQILRKKEKQYLGRKVKSWTQALMPAANHYDRRAKIDLPKGISGAYLLRATLANGNTSNIVVWNTKSLIIKKPVPNGNLYYVADSITGEPIKSAKLHFYGYAQEWQRSRTKESRGHYQTLIKRFAAQTNAVGQVILDSDKMSSHYQWLVHTDVQQDGFSVLGFNSVWYPSLSRRKLDNAKAYTITSQPVYRPEQTVKFKVWVRKSKYDLPDVSEYANRQFIVTILNPKNEEVHSKGYTADEYGGFSGELSFDKTASLGRYRILVSGIQGEGAFRLEEYKKPEFEVSVVAPDKPVKLGDKVLVKLSANYLFGAPVVNAKVKYKVQRYRHDAHWFPKMQWDWLYNPGYWWFSYDKPWYPGWNRWGHRRPAKSWWGPSYNPPELVTEEEVSIGADGSVSILIDTASAKILHGDSDQRYEITAEVTDGSRRTIVGSGKVLVAREAFKVYAWLDKGYYQKGDAIYANLFANTLNKKVISGKGELSLYKVSFGGDNNGAARGKIESDVIEKRVQKWRLDTNKQGKAAITLKAGSSGQYRLAYVLKDKKGNKVEGGYVFTVMGSSHDSANDADYRFNDLEIIADKQQYKKGDKLKLLINSNHKNATVLLFTRPESGVYFSPKIIKLAGKSKVVNVEILKKDMPNFFVEALMVADGKVYTEVKEIVVPPEERLLNVSIKTNKTDANPNQYKPNEDVSLKLSLTDAHGKPFVGSAVISFYDKALDYISGSSGLNDSIKAFFWDWRRHHNPNTRHSSEGGLPNIADKHNNTLQPIGVFGNQIQVSGVSQSKNKPSKPRPVARAKMESVSSISSEDVGRLPDGAMVESLQRLNGVAIDENSLDTSGVKIRKDFADSAFWNDSVTTDKDGIAEIKFPMPENLTTWKGMVWAMGHGTKVGQTDIELITTKKLLLRMQAPRFFVETDEVTLSANIHNYLEKTEKVSVVLELDGDNLLLLDKPQKKIKVKSNGEARVEWRVKVVKEGEAVVRMLAVSKHESDAMEQSFPVYIHGMLKTNSFSGALSLEQKQDVINFSVPESRRIEQSRFELRYSPSLAGAMVDALPYLVDYPYGCTEQTLSRFLPAVMVQKVLSQTGVDLKVIKDKQTNLNAQEIGDDKERAKDWGKATDTNPVFDELEVGLMAKAGLDRLYSMQVSDGGWGWFSGWGERSTPYTTAYVVHGLQIAKQNGLTVDDGIYQQGLNWLINYQNSEVEKLRQPPGQDKTYKSFADNLDAFVVMVLLDDIVKATAKNEDLSYMLDRLYKGRQHLSVYGKTLLALSLHKANRTKQRDQVRKNIEQFLVQDSENQTAYLKLSNGNYWWAWYGNEIEAQAYYLKLLTQVDVDSNIAPGLVKYLINNRKHASYWSSTRDTALVIESLAEYMITSGQVEPDISLDLLLDGKHLKTISINKDNLFSFDNKLVLNGHQLSAGEHQLELVKSGKGPLYYNAYLNNFTLEDFISKAGMEVKVVRKFYKLERVASKALISGTRGQAIEQNQVKYKRIPIQKNQPLESGDLIEVELLLESKNDYEYIMIEDMKAAGFEAADVRSGYNGNAMGAYVEYRDNRVVFFVQNLARGKSSVKYRLRAEIPGSFSALPTRVEAMYAPELKANSDEMKLLIEGG